jgi:hypothetical protein
MVILSLTFLLWSAIAAERLANHGNKQADKLHKVFSLLACAQRTR